MATSERTTRERQQIAYQKDQIAHLEKQIKAQQVAKASADSWLKNPTDVDQVAQYERQLARAAAMIEALTHSISMIELPDVRLARLERVQRELDSEPAPEDIVERRRYDRRKAERAAEVRRWREVVALVEDFPGHDL